MVVSRSTFLLLLLLTCILATSRGQKSLVRKKYTPDWESLDARPLPKWYDDVKIGIFVVWGPYSVPGVQSEWFWKDSEDPNSQASQYLQEYFPPKFLYQNFGSDLKMEFFNATKIADIISTSGAKYLVFTSKHHDGYCNWPSTYSYGWNSMAVGPKRDVIGELKDAITTNHPDINFGLYYSLFEWYNPIYLKDKANNFTTREYVLHKMQPEMKELINRFSPHVLWVDGDWEAHPEYFGSQDFLAWLYNSSPSKDIIVTNDRWGIGTQKKHGGFWSGPDRYDPGHLLPHKWENAMTIDMNSWGIRRDIQYEDIMGIDELLTKVVKAVSCGGNILINVGPTKEGTIIPIFEERLTQLGSWLKVNGEAIYSTKPWNYQNDTLNGNVWYTMKDSAVYAISLGWPENDKLLVGSPKVTEGQTKVSLLGSNDNLEFSESEGKVEIQFPSMSHVLSSCGSGCQWGYVVKMTNLASEEQIKIEQIL